MQEQTYSTLLSRAQHLNPDFAFLSVSGVPGAGKARFTESFAKKFEGVQVIPRVPTGLPSTAKEYFWDSCRYGIRQKDFQTALFGKSLSVVHLHHEAVEVFQWAVRAARAKKVKSVASVLLTCGDKDMLRSRIAQKGWEISGSDLQKIFSLQREYEDSGVYDLTIDTVNTTDAELLDRVTSCLS